ncbi:zinc finger protein 292 [Pelobates fuscus]|uniref:zinc finger protein 292 n=1 Tax=Pelobates fuscus TaxID=191477 RepID=UPI002FE4D3FA
MADGEAERERSPVPDMSAEIPRLAERLQQLESRLRTDTGGGDDPVQAATDYCQRFCQALLEYAEKWKAPEDSLPLLEVYTVAIESYTKARPYLNSECENVAVVLERLALSCVELLLCLPHELPDDHWARFQYSIQDAHKTLVTNGSHGLSLLFSISQEAGVWKDPVLQKILNQDAQDPYLIDRFLLSEGPLLLEMRIKRLLKVCKVAPATSLAKICSDHPELSKRGHFKQMYLTCLCADSPNIRLIEEIAKVDCNDALDMICNLESDGDEKTSLILCAAFLSRQLQFGEMYCAWELTLFWSKLQRRVDPSIQVYLERCRQLSLLTKTVYHIFFLIKVIQSETEAAGLPTCIELCVRALRLESSETSPKVKISICKTISCLLPDDLEVKRACQLSEFLLEPTVDAYYAVEMLYNQPDQKYDEESLPVPNSLRCELLLVLKTRWPFDPEFWDWKTLKRQCLALMGEEASIVSSIDELNDHEVYDQVDNYPDISKAAPLNGLEFFDTSNVGAVKDEKEKKRRIKKLRERGCISERFRNWQAYMQYCVLCDKEFLGHRIVRHAQKHCKDGIYSCPICAKEYNTKESFVPHVTLHVKQSSKERLETMGSARRLPKMPKKAPLCKTKKPVVVSKQVRSIKKNSLYSEDFIVFKDDDSDDRNNQSDSLRTEKLVTFDEFPCPVHFCKKGFKYFKNLIAHVRGHKDCEEATRFLEIQSKKVVCQYCRRQFVSLMHLNDHLQMHCGSHPYFCIQMKCKAAFDSYAELLTHRKEHRVFRARCVFPKCGRIFSAAYMLFDHEAQHYNTFTCKNYGCGKIYHTQLQLEKHLCEHAAEVVKQESNSDAEITDLPKTEANNEHVDVKEESLPDCSTNNDLNSLSLQLEAAKDVPLNNNPNHIPTVLSEKPESLLPVPEKQTMHLQDNLPSPTVLPATNLPCPVLQSTSHSLDHSLELKNNVLPLPSLSDDSNDKIPTLNKGLGDILINRNKEIDACGTKDLTETPEHPNTGTGDSRFQVFQECKVNTPNDSVMDETLSNNFCESKVKIEDHINSVMSFHTENQPPPLCENTLVMPGYEERVKSENALSLSLETSSLLSNVLPPVLSTTTVTPHPPVPPQRFKCKVEGCTRIYNSVQSIGKHMKTTHPDHYADFKMERKNRKKLKAGSSAQNLPNEQTYQILTPADGSGSPTFLSPVQNAIPSFQSPVQNTSPSFQSQVQSSTPSFQSQVQSSTPSFQSPLNNTANTNFCNQLQHIPNTVFPTHLESLVNPLLNSVESIITQGLSKNVADTLLGSEVGSLTNATLTSQLEDLAKVVLPLKFENGSDPFLPMPTENDPLPVLSSLSGSTMFSQLGSNTDHVLSGGEAANSVFLKDETDAVTSFTKQVEGTDIEASFNLEKSSSMLSNTGENKTSGRTTRNRERKPKHSARAKCPAIIRDGKFICSRCFRVFTNPRSLGGHLSKRTVCKPHNEFDISHVPVTDGQTPVLASLMMSDSHKQTLPLPPQTFNPDVTLKEEPFCPPISTSDSTPFLQSGLGHPNTPNFKPCLKKEVNLVNQKLESPNTVDHTKINLNMSSQNCMSENTISSPNLSSMITPHVVQTATTLDYSSNIVNNCVSEGSFPEEGCLKMDENGLCSNTVLNSPEENNCISSPVGTSRVSVISGPQKSPATSAKKKSGGSKKKKKIADVPAADGASHELVKNILAALGNLPTSITGNSQVPSEMQPNFLAYGTELLENIAKHLNSADKQLFLAYINESLKANSEEHVSSQNAPASDKSDTLTFTNFTTDHKEQAELETNCMEKPFNHSESDAHVVFPVNTQNVCSSLPQNQDIIDTVEATIDAVHNTDSASSPVGKMNIPVCSVSPTQEVNPKLDTEVLEIMDLVQKMQLVDSFIQEELATDPQPECPPVDSLPQTSSVIVPNPSLNISHEETEELSQPLIDKCIAKPFICQETDCSYCAMTKDALFKHYAKVHYYTQEKILEIKKHQLKFAPFRCVVPSCTKTFTRNSNLRAHCQTMHRFTTDQMVKLKIKRPYDRKSFSEGGTDPILEMSPKMAEGEKGSELKTVPPLIIKREPESCQSKPILQAVQPPEVQNVSDLQDVDSLQPETKKGPKIRKKRKEKDLKLKKNLLKDPKPSNVLTSYKPYQCVHQGCTAAFTIQQNLILHYQAVHKSDLSKFSLEEDAKDDSENGLLLREFRCMETDCSRIFQEVASLIQHYVNFHEMIAEEIENVIAFIHIGQFKCDQHKCTSIFTTCAGYIEHLEAAHEIKMKQIKLDGDEMYKCDCEGCDRVYATRSNLLRHIFHKHNDKHKEHLLRPRKISLSDQESPEEKNQKEKHKVPKLKLEGEGAEVPKSKRAKGNSLEKDSKGVKGQEKPGPLSLKYGRHTYLLKPKDVALEECTENLAKQYPCMVRGCKSVVTSEFNIMRHYKCHKLSRAFILKHKKALVVCKRRVQAKPHTGSPKHEPTEDTAKTEVQKEVPPPQAVAIPSLIESSDESTISTSQQSETEKDEMDELAELFIAKLSNEENTGSDSQAKTLSLANNDLQETSSCQSEPQRDASNLKRTNKQKSPTPNRKRKNDSSEEIPSVETCSMVSGEEIPSTELILEESPALDLSSFKPMGFEFSFLKFLEESAAKENKRVQSHHINEPETDLQPVEKKLRLSEEEDLLWDNFDTDTYLLFANPSHLPGLDSVKLVLDQSLNNYVDLIIKQLNELNPVVVLKRQEFSWDNSASVAKEQSLDIDGDADV